MNIVLLIPSFKGDGPIKGAIALANLLCQQHNVFLVSMRNTYKVPIDNVNENIEINFLNSKSYISKFFEYSDLIKNLSQTDKTVSFSMLFFPDLFNVFISRSILKVCSIRSNMFKNYFFDYGYIGYLYAIIHYFFLRFIGHIIVMDLSMSKIVKKFTKNKITIISNFVDEQFLLKFRTVKKTERNSIIFLGSLTKRKSVDKLIICFSSLVGRYPNLILDIVGTGPEYYYLKELVNRLNLKSKVFFHGHLENPYVLLSTASVFVLPSKSEGTSRASLESLYLNVPVILKNVDGNKFLINSSNGELFNQYSDLEMSIDKVLNKNFLNKNLLPKVYTYSFVKDQYQDFFLNLK